VRIAWLCLAAAALVVIPAGLGGVRHAALEPLPLSTCSPVVYRGSGSPSLLIASDLPIAAFQFRSTTLRMQKAIEYVLARHRYRAGRYAVAYQPCDDSTAESDPGDLTKCAANAKTYAADPSVVGVLGTWNSPCTGVELPILNRAEGGPLALVSPSNTKVGLTHAGVATDRGEPGRYYPSGRRSFARVIAADDEQGAADAFLASGLGLRRVFVLDDRESYGLTVVGPFLSAAHALRVKIVGRASWGEEQKSFKTLARRVAAAQPDGVFLGGFACVACGALLKQLRAAIGPGPVLIAPDGWSPASNLAKLAGPASQGMYVTVPGLPASRLGALGRRIAARYGSGHLGSGGPAYAAQAAEALLAAIARSGGTRAAVSEQLYKVRMKPGILGSFRFDRNGDPTLAPVTVFRVQGAHGRVDRVVAPPHRLLRG
jgi:branched-chain amino acid transport system substrate-binding protein